MTEVRISVAKDFSRTPGPRYAKQGKWSGETFRRELVRKLRQCDRVIVDLDGTAGYGSSFLDEAFGGLVREEGFSREDLAQRLIIESNQDPTYKHEAERAIKIAEVEDRRPR